MSATPQILDAAGRVPIPLTAFEIKVAAATSTGVITQRQAELAAKQALPLASKIELSMRLIRDWLSLIHI